MQKLEGFEITEHEKSKRIINIKIGDEILDKLIFPFNKFDITALEYKPFTRFTIAKSLDDLTNNKLSKLLNSVLRNRNTGCFIIKPKNIINLRAYIFRTNNKTTRTSISNYKIY